MKVVILMEDTCADSSCAYEHGLSVYIETKKHRLLVDTGKTDAFIRNAQKLGIDLAGVDTVILSHGHYDHAGGILAFHQHNSRAKIYMQRAAGDDYYHNDRYIGIDKRILELSQIQTLDGDLRIDEELFLFTNITGRTYFSKSNLLLSKRVDGQNIPDSFAHEQCLVVTQDKEHMLFSGCAHNGILNILDRYREYFASDPKFVVSGFHMMKKGAYTQEETEAICQTAQRLNRMDTVFYTGHCTGEPAYLLMEPYMDGKLRRIHSGTRIL